MLVRRKAIYKAIQFKSAKEAEVIAKVLEEQDYQLQSKAGALQLKIRDNVMDIRDYVLIDSDNVAFFIKEEEFNLDFIQTKKR